MAAAIAGSKSDAPANKRAERCPSWRQLYRITATLCEAAGIEAPKTARDASALIERLDALSGTHEGGKVDTCPF